MQNRLNYEKTTGYAWYSSETPDSDLKSIVIGEKIYSAKKHTSELKNELKCPRFYTWDDGSGKTENGMALDDYKELKDDYVLITKTIGAYEFVNDNEIVGEIIGGNSLMVACAKLGMHFVCCAPKNLWPEENLTDECRKIAEGTGAKIEMTEDIMEGTKNADAIYTKCIPNLAQTTIKEFPTLFLPSPQKTNFLPFRLPNSS